MHEMVTAFSDIFIKPMPALIWRLSRLSNSPMRTLFCPMLDS